MDATCAGSKAPMAAVLSEPKLITLSCAVVRALAWAASRPATDADESWILNRVREMPDTFDVTVGQDCRTVFVELRDKNFEIDPAPPIWTEDDVVEARTLLASRDIVLADLFFKQGMPALRRNKRLILDFQLLVQRAQFSVTDLGSPRQIAFALGLVAGRA